MSSLDLNHYIGVTGVVNSHECAETLATAKSLGLSTEIGHSLMTGFLVSPSTVSNNAPTNTDKPFRHVFSMEELVASLKLAQSGGVIGMAHFELSKGRRRDFRDPQHVVTLLHKLRDYDLAPAVQLNGVLTTDGIHHIAKETGAKLVFQLREEHSELGDRGIADILESLQGVVSKILIDPSMGSGKAVSIEEAIRMQLLLEKNFPGVFSFGYAGGLGKDAASTARFVGAVAQFLGSRAFSIDVETNVRSPGEHGDHLDQIKFAEYLRGSFSGFQST